MFAAHYPQGFLDVQYKFQPNPVKNKQLNTHTKNGKNDEMMKLQKFITKKVFGVELQDFARSHEFNRSFHMNFFKKIHDMNWEKF